MTDKAPIYIPTYRRVDRQTTARWLPLNWPVMLVAVEDEAEALRKRGHRVLSCPVMGIGPTRQWVLDNHSVDIWGPRLLMMDDDLRFYVRRTDDPAKFTQLSKDQPEPEKIESMLYDTLDLMDVSPLVGIANRSGANRSTQAVRTNCRMHDLFGVDVEVARKEGFHIDRVRFMEDFDFILQFLTAGYTTSMLNTHCKGDVGSNVTGGCSEYRDAAGQAEAAEQLAKMWPDYVKLRQVKAKGEGMWGERTDVTVQWAKAARDGEAAMG